jgi:nitric oxide reductase NorE protein
MAVIESTNERSAAGGSDLILWLLVWSELAAFGILLTGFMVMSLMEPDSFAAAKLHLDVPLASVNTVVLLTSGWLAAEAARAKTEIWRRRTLLGSAALGFLFAAIKLIEYRGEIPFAGDASLASFFELYFLITGFHLAHVVFLALVMLLIARKPAASNVAIVTTVWHVVDLVWLVIFPVVYLG